MSKVDMGNMESKDINDIRKEINAIDDDLLRLFVRRLEIVRDVAASKKERGAPVFDPEREPDATAFYHHHDGDSHLVYLDFHKPLKNKNISLPKELCGKKISIIEKTPSVTLHTANTVPANGICLEPNQSRAALGCFYVFINRQLTRTAICVAIASLHWLQYNTITNSDLSYLNGSFNHIFTPSFLIFYHMQKDMYIIIFAQYMTLFAKQGAIIYFTLSFLWFSLYNKKG